MVFSTEASGTASPFLVGSGILFLFLSYLKTKEK